MKAPVYLYHGTSFHRWRQLQESGTTTLIYLAKSPSYTDHYRLNAVEQDESYNDIAPEKNPEVIVRFSTEALRCTGTLMPDWDDVQVNLALFPNAVVPADVTWLESLAVLGTCSYKGLLTGAILRVRVLK